MTNKEYILKLFDVSADQLGVPFVKTTPTKLQSWATKKEPPFIALINNLPRDTEKNDLRNNIYSYQCVFMICGSTKKDPTIESKISVDVDLEVLADRFVDFVEKGEKVLDVTNASGEELFRGTTFNGMAYALNFTISLPNMNDLCVDWCNDSTKRIDCND